MADTAANAYLRISRALASQDRDVIEKIAITIWARIATLPEPPGVSGLNIDDLILLFQKIATPSKNRDFRELELAAEEGDGLPAGDFWAACVYVSMLLFSEDNDCIGYLIDRYLSFLEKLYPNEPRKIDFEVDLVMRSIIYVFSSSAVRSEELLVYAWRALRA